MCIDKVVHACDFEYVSSSFHVDCIAYHSLDKDIHMAFLRCVISCVFVTCNLPKVIFKWRLSTNIIQRRKGSYGAQRSKGE